MPRPRTTYTAEYKLAAVKMITEQKLSVAEVARRLDVSETLLRAWRKAVLAGGDAAFPGHGNPAPADDELRRLRAENARLRAELSAETRDVTVVIVAQRVSTILSADRIIVLDDGVVVGSGTHVELMLSCPEYREIVVSQLGENAA